MPMTADFHSMVNNTDPLFALVIWLQNAMLGTIATVIAGLAVALVGALMLTGRLNWRRGSTVVVGCFILFGAPRIAAGISSTTGQSDSAAPVAALPPPDFGKVVSIPVKAASAPYDPYAGAAVQQAARPIQ
jgi:type IV secretory pathway VirB2 component (pilin)